MALIYQDPGMDPAERMAANARHDRERHTVCMWARAKYRGGFGYPRMGEERVRMGREEFLRRRAEVMKEMGMAE